MMADSAGAPATILQGRQIKVGRGDRLILDVQEISVRKSEVVSLIGPNGAGKTTLLQTLCYLLKPFKGEILFQGKRVPSEYPLLDYRRGLAMVFQEPLLFDATVFENVASGLKFRNVGRSEISATVEENLIRFGIQHLRQRSARTLSGGEAQRTSLARAFATKPELLLLDEPFSALDQPTRESLIADLEQALQNAGTTALFATHDRMEALRLSHRIAVMEGGRILQIGPPLEIMHHPVSEFAASFAGIETSLQGLITGQREGTFLVSTAGRQIEVAGNSTNGKDVMIFIRPENVVISPASSHGSTSARNVFTGTVQKVIPLGPYQKIMLDCGFPLVAYVTNDSCRDLGLAEGKEITASFKATAVHMIPAKDRDFT
jgi:tungstate transport system ATP-binding protein